MSDVEQPRLEKINYSVAGHVQDYLEQLANEEIDSDDLLSLVYAGLVTSMMLGYNPEELIEDVKMSVQRIKDISGEDND